MSIHSRSFFHRNRRGRLTPYAELEDVLQSGRDAAAGGHWDEAEEDFWAVCRGILDILLETDDEGELRELVCEAATGLASCLGKADRGRVLKRMLWIVRWDLTEGGGLGFTEAVLGGLDCELSAGERREVRRLVASVPHTNWSRMAWAEFVLATHTAEDDPLLLEWFPEHCLSEGLFFLLLRMGRGEAAFEVARDFLCGFDWDRLQACERLEGSGFRDLAVRLAQLGADGAQDRRLLDWLAPRVEPSQSFALRLRRWELYADLDGYVALRDTGAPNWESLRVELLNRLSRQRRHELCMEIHALEGDWEAAWGSAGQCNLHARLSLAERCQREQPERAGEVYLESARCLIAKRGRDRYARAAEHLSRAARLVSRERLDMALREIWAEAYRLPALRQELTRAGFSQAGLKWRL